MKVPTAKRVNDLPTTRLPRSLGFIVVSLATQFAPHFCKDRFPGILPEKVPARSRVEDNFRARKVGASGCRTGLVRLEVFRTQRFRDSTRLLLWEIVRGSHKSLRIVAILMLCIVTTSTSRAYNSDTHQELVEYAYQVMQVMSEANQTTTSQSGIRISNELANDARRAIQYLRDLQAGLPPPKKSNCVDADAFKAIWGTPAPDWRNANEFGTMKLGATAYPIVHTYFSGDDCGINVHWRAGNLYDRFNKGSGYQGRDYSGTVLGFWAQYPDDLDSEFTVGSKLTNAGSTSWFKEIAEAAGAGAAATIWVPIRCLADCTLGFLGLDPGRCADCIKRAIEDGRNASHDTVATLDSWVPVMGSIKSGEVLTGMCHHINVALDNRDFDVVSGYKMTEAGPNRLPGAFESLSIALADAAGVTIQYDDSQAPRNYEVTNGQDSHPNSRPRGASDWEYLTFPHIPMTPLDNFAWYGYNEFKKSGNTNAKFLAWPLHALGDATVPMHVTGTGAHGHRPYEDAVSRIHREMTLDGSVGVEIERIRGVIAPRVIAWRRWIADWRRTHPEHRTDVPIREMVTRLAAITWGVAQREPSVFNDALSTYYLAGLKSQSTTIYLSKRRVMQRLHDEGTAATIAFLLSLPEIRP